LGFWEFSNAFLPFDIRYREELEHRQASYEMSIETREVFRRVLRGAIEAE
jgi:hypothetical protein